MHTGNPAYFRMRDDIYSGIHRQGKPHAKVRVDAFVPGERFHQVCICSGVQTTASVTVS
jgi:hypothetical protein